MLLYEIISIFDDKKIKYALIGGYALEKLKLKN